MLSSVEATWSGFRFIRILVVKGLDCVLSILQIFDRADSRFIVVCSLHKILQLRAPLAAAVVSEEVHNFLNLSLVVIFHFDGGRGVRTLPRYVILVCGTEPADMKHKMNVNSG